ncbi:MAG: GGDEF domain-containing protein [Spirochaetales bacterium]|nr:GGDEF domain-containing protein [Spirochaetales bacterium]
MENLVDFLKQVHILQDLSFLERKAVGECLKTVNLKKDETLFLEGDTAREMYIVKNGFIGSYKTLSDGAKLEMARFSRGKFFGEMSIIDQKNRSLTCYALTDAELLALEAIDFYLFVWEHPMIGNKILKSMVGYMVSWLNEAEDFLNSLVLWGTKARYQTITDELTGLHNRRFFEESIDSRITQFKNRNFCLLMCDLDNFHQVNSLWGPETGDMMLKIVAELLKNSFPANAVIARLDGDEFAALLPQTTKKDAVSMVEEVKKNLELINNNLNMGKESLSRPVTLSVGISEYPEHGQKADDLMKLTDKALFEAKKKGKNKIHYAGQE